MGTLKINRITGRSGSVNNAPITLDGDAATLNSGVTFPAGHIIKTNHKYIIKDFYEHSSRTWSNVETHTNIMTGLTNGNKLRVVFDGFKIISQQGSYGMVLFSVFPNGTTDTAPGNSSTTPLGKKMLMTEYVNSQSRGYLGTLTVEITVAAAAYDCKIYLLSEDNGYTAKLHNPGGADGNGNDNTTRAAGSSAEAQFMTGASMTCYEIQG